MKEVELTVNSGNFLDWFFDYYMVKDLGFDVVKELRDKGKYQLTVDDVFDNCEYIPISLINEIDTNNEIRGVLETFEDEEIFFEDLNAFTHEDVKYIVKLKN